MNLTTILGLDPHSPPCTPPMQPQDRSSSPKLPTSRISPRLQWSKVAIGVLLGYSKGHWRLWWAKMVSVRCKQELPTENWSPFVQYSPIFVPNCFIRSVATMRSLFQSAVVSCRTDLPAHDAIFGSSKIVTKSQGKTRAGCCVVGQGHQIYSNPRIDSIKM